MPYRADLDTTTTPVTKSAIPDGSWMMADKTVKNPTYMNHIQYFFDQKDIDCMNRELEDFDLSTYKGVRKNAGRVFSQTLQPGGNMPPQADRKWSKARSKTFRNWMLNKYPLGVPKANKLPTKAARTAARVRKDIRDLDKNEIKLLKKAFSAIMQRLPDEENSFTSIAEIHGLPNRQYCLHHEGEFQPWHRVYLEKMEDALRSVEGCEQVTLPYWDISGDVPKVLFQKPFASFVLQKAADPTWFPVGFKTKRNTRKQIDDGLKLYRMAKKVQKALNQPQWERFNSGLESCHDSGHVYCGETIADANVTAYDPMFWFFHCNWDRLWWRWQHAVGAKDVKTFKATTTEEVYWLEPPINDLDPFAPITSDLTIPVDNLHYAPSRDDKAPKFDTSGFGNARAAESFSIRTGDAVSVRVKGIHRLNVPGSFFISLMANGKMIDQEGFFQSTTPVECASCREKSIVNIDFDVRLGAIADKDLSVRVERIVKGGATRRVSLNKIGNPTINIRHLITTK